MRDFAWSVLFIAVLTFAGLSYTLLTPRELFVVSIIGFIGGLIGAHVTPAVYSEEGDSLFGLLMLVSLVGALVSLFKWGFSS